MRRVVLLVLLVGCKSEATKRREVFDCALTGATATCLQMRYGWTEQDALVVAFKLRMNAEASAELDRQAAESLADAELWRKADSLGTSCYYPKKC